jgi:hypothetical protein
MRIHNYGGAKALQHMDEGPAAPLKLTPRFSGHAADSKDHLGFNV